MHDTALLNAERFFNVYVRHTENTVVVDIGAQDVTGSLKQFCPKGAKYIGVDFVAGKGVDVVLEDPYRLPFETESIDVVVSSSCFEHSEFFWVLYLEILRILKPSGIFYLNVPTNGRFHRYPVDCWRFYPDSGHALAKWAHSNDLNTVILESFTSNQIRLWNDYVCVFIKDEKYAGKHTRRILDSFTDFTNGFVFNQQSNSTNLLNKSEIPQDQRFLGWRIHKFVSRLLQKLFKFELVHKRKKGNS